MKIGKNDWNDWKPLVKNGLEAPLVKKKEKRFIPVHVVVLLCWIATSLGLTVHSALRYERQS